MVNGGRGGGGSREPPETTLDPTRSLKRFFNKNLRHNHSISTHMSRPAQIIAKSSANCSILPPDHAASVAGAV